MADIFSMIPAGPQALGRQVSDYISQSKTDIPNAANSARNAAEVSDKVIQDVIKSTIPFGGDMGSMVQNRPQVMLPQPIRPKQIPMGEPIGQVNATTRAGQQRNDIGSLISSVSNIVKMSVNKKREKEDQALMSDLAIIEAASSNPNDPHNKAIIQAIADDPKRTKRLEKALGYNPLSGEPPPPEAQTMSKYSAQSQQKKQQKTQAITQAIAQKLGPQAVQGHGQDVMGNLMSRMPNTQQLSPVVALQAELIKAGILPKADTSLNAMKDLIKEVMTNDAKYAEIKAKIEVSQNEALSRWLIAVQNAKAKYETEVLKQTNENSRTAANINSREKIADLHSKDYKERTVLMKNKLEKQYGSQKAANLIATISAFDRDIAAIQKEIDSTSLRGGGADGGKYRGDVDKLYQKLHAKQKEKDALMTVLKLKDPDVQPSGVDLLNMPDASTEDMDEEDETEELFE